MYLMLEAACRTRKRLIGSNALYKVDRHIQLGMQLTDYPTPALIITAL
jgi:hypothetical protein